jgi:hypothetical protein
MKRIGFMLLLFLALSTAVAPSAQADGGASLSTAPTVTSGSTYSASFSSDRLSHGNTELWKVRLLLGDDLLLNAIRSRGASSFVVKVLPVGTDEATLWTKRPVYEARLSSPVAVTASRSGTYPIAISCNTSRRCTTIRFSVVITHELVVHIPRSTRLSLTGTFTVVVRTPGGNPVTGRDLIVSLYGLWRDSSASVTHHVLGSTKVIRGQAVFTYHLPAGLAEKTISLQAIVDGPGYRTASSALCEANVA